MTTPLENIVHDILSQLKIHDTINAKANIAVYLAKQNMHPVIDRLLEKAALLFDRPFTNLYSLEWFLKESAGHQLNIWQKPDPYPVPSNHLLLTVGGLTTIIFDYEEHISE